MIRLPVSGTEVLLRAPDGADDIALLEGEAAILPGALGLLDRLARRADGGALEGAMLPVTDFEILLLRLREMLLGGQIASFVNCSRCGERAELSFRIADYLAGIHAVPDVPPPDAEGWHAEGSEKFRPPRVADLLAVANERHPGAALRALCAPVKVGSARARIARAVARLAPEVSGEVGGACPDCGTALSVWFDVKTYVMTELRRLAGGVYAEVHLLARAYGWAEAAILALPGDRRRRYAALVRDAGTDIRADATNWALT